MELEDLGFPHYYSVRTPTQTTAQTTEYCFELTRLQTDKTKLSFETQPRGKNTRLVEVVTAEGKVWTGKFEVGDCGLSGFFATPSPDILFVVMEGQGYWVPTLDPESYEVVATVPINQVLRVPERQIMFFLDFTRVEAYGTKGFLWQSDSLSWDGLQITHVTNNCIRGLGWDSPADSHIEFDIDTSSGATKGGSSPQHYLNPRLDK